MSFKNIQDIDIIITYNKYMKLAINEAKKAFNTGCLAVGSVVVKDDCIIGMGFNQTVPFNDASAHAEVLSMREASKFIKSTRLDNCVLYSTHEPCCMCTGMAGFSGVSTIVYGVGVNDMQYRWDIKLISCKNIIDMYDWNIFVVSNILEEECLELDNFNYNEYE